jgi:hypothetical protein
MAEMPTPTQSSAALVDLTKDLTAAAEEPAGWRRAPGLIQELERALLTLSAGWHSLAPLAAPTVAALRSHEPASNVPTGLSRSQEVQLISALHDLSTDLAGAARACRNTRAIVEPLVLRRLLASESRDDARPPD